MRGAKVPRPPPRQWFSYLTLYVAPNAANCSAANRIVPHIVFTPHSNILSRLNVIKNDIIMTTAPAK